MHLSGTHNGIVADFVPGSPKYQIQLKINSPAFGFI
jgi:hypothetical protein